MANVSLLASSECWYVSSFSTKRNNYLKPFLHVLGNKLLLNTPKSWYYIVLVTPAILMLLPFLIFAILLPIKIRRTINFYIKGGSKSTVRMVFNCTIRNIEQELRGELKIPADRDIELFFNGELWSSFWLDTFKNYLGMVFIFVLGSTNEIKTAEDKDFKGFVDNIPAILSELG